MGVRHVEALTPAMATTGFAATSSACWQPGLLLEARWRWTRSGTAWLVAANGVNGTIADARIFAAARTRTGQSPGSRSALARMGR